MKVGFAGTPAFAAHVLAALLDADSPVSLVLTQPDRPRGRGQKHAPSPVKELALERATPVSPAADARRATAARALLAHGPRCARRRRVRPHPAARRSSPGPGDGCINVHASLLPRWRGAAPIQRALLAGDDGNRRHADADGRGPRHGTDARCRPHSDRRARDARARSRRSSRRSARACSSPVCAGSRRARRSPRTPQPAAGATYASKIRKGEADIDWTRPPRSIDRQVRAFDPAPGATRRSGRASESRCGGRNPARARGATRRPGRCSHRRRGGHRRRVRRGRRRARGAAARRRPTDERGRLRRRARLAPGATLRRFGARATLAP